MKDFVTFGPVVIFASIIFISIDDVIGALGWITINVPNSTSVNDADQHCKKTNGSLMYMSHELIAETADYYSGKLSFDLTILTKHRVEKSLYTENEKYAEIIPEQQTENLTDDMWCIAIIINMKDGSNGSYVWYPLDCNFKFIIIFFYCLNHEPHRGSWHYETHPETVTSAEARDTCDQSGGSLLTFGEDEHSDHIFPLFFTQEFGDKMKDQFWVSEDVDYVPHSGTVFPCVDDDDNYGNCTYFSIVRGKTTEEDIIWCLKAKCNSSYSFICKKPGNHIVSYIVKPFSKHNYNVLKFESKRSSKHECAKECQRLVAIGYPCDSVNYHRTNGSCEYLERYLFKIATFMYSEEWDYIFPTDFSVKYLTEGMSTNPSSAVSSTEGMSTDLSSAVSSTEGMSTDPSSAVSSSEGMSTDPSSAVSSTEEEYSETIASMSTKSHYYSSTEVPDASDEQTSSKPTDEGRAYTAFSVTVSTVAIFVLVKQIIKKTTGVTSYGLRRTEIKENLDEEVDEEEDDDDDVSDYFKERNENVYHNICPINHSFQLPFNYYDKILKKN